MAELPKEFLQTMQRLLGEEYELFLKGFDGRRQFGLRVNTSKISLEEFERIAPFHLTKIPWISNGYFYEEEDAPARHPFYAAGLYYLQEPSAMTPASRLKVVPGDYVLDLCAAPGGKATALAAELRGEGLIVANDINTARARALLRNMELFGVKNAFVTNEPPHVLAEKYPQFFDKIMVDAPCSGEGMFRKNPAVMEAWEEKGPDYFSKLQREIIVHGADMLKPGGTMLYSTCTFAPAENERTITHLLRERPEMEIIPMEEYEGFAPGLTSFDGEEFHESCQLCRRIWPHKMAGEGHFLALLHKKEVDSVMISDETGDLEETDKNVAGSMDAEQIINQPVEIYNDKKKTKKEKKKQRKKGNSGSAKEKDWWDALKFLDPEPKKALSEFFSHVSWDFTAEHVDIRGDKVYYVPGRDYERGPIHFLRNGVYLGDLKKKRFEPSQPLALALSADTYDRILDFPENDPRLQKYMIGETLMVEDILEEKKTKGEPTDNGWYLVTACGYPLGFGKLAGNVLKNKYPTGWRKNN